MSNTLCLIAPGFSISGTQQIINQQANFSFEFDSVEDQALVLAYQWYLNGNLVINKNQPTFTEQMPVGTYNIGGRILTSDGWSGVKTISFEIFSAPQSITIAGPWVVLEGQDANYQIMAKYSASFTLNITNEYTFTSDDGTFVGGLFTATNNLNVSDNRLATITAIKAGANSITKQIIIADTSFTEHIGVLVVDLFSNPNLNAIALIENPEVVENNLPAHTGNNIIPALASPPEALILASDIIPQSVLNWRFEFNITKLLLDYPNTSQFVFYIKGRSNVQGTISGAYAFKKFASMMTLSGSAGSYVPSVNGGHISITPFSATVTAGANGSYLANDLPTIIKITYNVSTKTFI